ncbi:hypothetical protein FISHEDRAFT_70338 [Fistulina hepatica ATCC 64428]|uniref:C2H2-type domain-containing protein n=1 Tax=Fistulina hepatica ATCC 64428 TaxID=1128425 RepID=A0A0D7AJA7_9AGAR|nr:hypothetical protein FISHEDRAFT_70338 [Fistulina hepatica ATCC 64428]
MHPSARLDYTEPPAPGRDSARTKGDRRHSEPFARPTLAAQAPCTPKRGRAYTDRQPRTLRPQPPAVRKFPSASKGFVWCNACNVRLPDDNAFRFHLAMSEKHPDDEPLEVSYSFAEFKPFGRKEKPRDPGRSAVHARNQPQSQTPVPRPQSHNTRPRRLRPGDIPSASEGFLWCNVCNVRLVDEEAFLVHLGMSEKHPPGEPLEVSYGSIEFVPFDQDPSVRHSSKVAQPSKKAAHATSQSPKSSNRTSPSSPATPKSSLAPTSFSPKPRATSSSSVSAPPPPPPIFFCRMCNIRFPSETAFSAHLEESSKHPRCKVCKVSYYDMKAFDHHFVNSKSHHFCVDCSRDFETDYLRDVHRMSCDDAVINQTEEWIRKWYINDGRAKEVLAQFQPTSVGSRSVQLTRSQSYEDPSRRVAHSGRRRASESRPVRPDWDNYPVGEEEDHVSPESKTQFIQHHYDVHEGKTVRKRNKRRGL